MSYLLHTHVWTELVSRLSMHVEPCRNVFFTCCVWCRSSLNSKCQGVPLKQQWFPQRHIALAPVKLVCTASEVVIKVFRFISLCDCVGSRKHQRFHSILSAVKPVKLIVLFSLQLQDCTLAWNLFKTTWMVLKLFCHEAENKFFLCSWKVETLKIQGYGLSLYCILIGRTNLEGHAYIHLHQGSVNTV